MTAIKYRDSDGQIKAITYRNRGHNELSGRLGTDHHTQYATTARLDETHVRRSGGTTKKLNIISKNSARGQWDGGLLLHYPNVSWARLRSNYDGNGGYHLRVEDGGDKHTLVPVFAAYPPTENHMATVQYCQDVYAPRINGPHGGPGHGYQVLPKDMTIQPYWNRVLYLKNYPIPGLIKLKVFFYGHVHSASTTVSLYSDIYMRWDSGQPCDFTNGGIKVKGTRLAVGINIAEGYEAMVAEGWVVNRTDSSLLFGPSCSAGLGANPSGAEGAEFGNQVRVCAEFWPYAETYGGLNVGWHSW